MRQYLYQIVTGHAAQFQATLTTLGSEGWRLVTAAPTSDVWSAVLEQEVAAGDRHGAVPRAQVEVRDGEGAVTTTLIDADGLAIVEGVAYLRRADEVLATYLVEDLVAVTWQSGSTYAQTLERKRRDHPRHGESWSIDEDEQLRREHSAGWPVKAMVAEHQRGRGAIEARLAKLGLEYPIKSPPLRSPGPH